MELQRPENFLPVLSNNFTQRLIIAAFSDLDKRKREEAIQEELVKIGEYKPLNDIINDCAYDEIDGQDQDN